MEYDELGSILSEKVKKWEKGYYLYCKVFLDDLNITIDFKKGDTISISSNGFLTIGSTCFYQIEAIYDIEFY